jgi:hypothetical protein
MDSWDDTPLRFQFPHLFSFALDNDITLEMFTTLCNQDDIEYMFYFPLSLVPAHQFEELSSIVLNRNITRPSDSWILRDSKKMYSSKRVYHALAPSDPAPRPMMWIWKSCVLPRIKIFFGFSYKTGLTPENF